MTHNWIDVYNSQERTNSADEIEKMAREAMTPNNGGGAVYYTLPPEASELQDIIEARNMNFAIGNIFKAAYRLGQDTHSTPDRDLRKIIWFARRELRRIGAEID